MEKIGITGSLGTGKSVVSNYFKKMGHLVISADFINAELLNEEDVILKVNSLLFGEDSEYLDKKRIAELIFSNKEKKKELEDYLHPMIYAKMKEIIDNCDEEIVFLEIPLLFETNFIELVDYVIVVYANKTEQIKRIRKRDGLTKVEAEKRINEQMPIYEKILKADYVIDNNKTIKHTEQQLKEWYEAFRGNYGNIQNSR